MEGKYQLNSLPAAEPAETYRIVHTIVPAGANIRRQPSMHDQEKTGTTAQPAERYALLRCGSEPEKINIWTLDLRTDVITGSVLFGNASSQQPIVSDQVALRPAICPDDRDCWRAAFTKAVASGTEYHAE